MKRLNGPMWKKRFSIRDERGMTLIEVLTSLMILGMVASILYSFLLMGVSMYKRVTIETQLRNQGDSLYSLIISELKDAVYVEQVEDATNRTIHYVKRASDPKVYVEQYEMTLNPNPDAGGNLVVKKITPPEMTRTFQMSSQFTISGGELVAESHNLVQVHLAYSRSNAGSLKPADRPVLEIHSQIPLFRIE